MDTYNEQMQLISEGRKLRSDILIVETSLIENPDHAGQATLNEKRARLQVVESALESYGTTLNAELLTE